MDGLGETLGMLSARTKLQVRRERGFALPMTILLVAMLTVMLSAAFARVSADRRVADSTEWTVASLAVAQSALSTYMNSQTLPPTDGDSVRINVTGGYAWVVPRIIQDPPDPVLPKKYVIRSTAFVIDPAQGSEPLATRTVAQFAQWQPGDIRRVSAFTAAGDNPAIQEEGGAGSADMWIDGEDQCAEAPAIPGVRTHNSSQLAANNPDSESRNLNVGGSAMQVALETGIDWAAITSGEALLPDYTALVPDDTTYKTYYIDAYRLVTNNVRGTGLLVITGELETKGSYFEWDGVVLLGRHLDTDASNTEIQGLLVTGLNTLTGGPDPHYNEVDEDRSHIYYDSCKVRRAVARWKGFVPMPSSWVDSWATY
jgi:type II secretory pathway pseudopilin PulG